MQSSRQRGLLAITSAFGEIFSTSEYGKKAKSELMVREKSKCSNFLNLRIKVRIDGPSGPIKS
jgi:hypothetical protein